jgi:DNA-binding transcriptional ArsR family regulator
MDISTATHALSALAHENRLGTFRLLIETGVDGMSAGDIARSLGIPHNTMSTHLAILTRAGLLNSRRDGRSIFYSVDFDGTRGLLGFLIQDCCKGNPEICKLDDLMAVC